MVVYSNFDNVAVKSLAFGAPGAEAPLNVAPTDLDRSVKKVTGALKAVDTGGGIFSWANPEAGPILVIHVVVTTTTKTTGACTIDVGTTAISATTSSDTLIDGIDLNPAVGTFTNDESAGSNGKPFKRLAAGKWVTASKATGASAGLVGTYEIYYITLQLGWCRMNFEELRQRLRWTCDDGTNSEDLEVLYPNMDGMLINEAIRNLADCLNLVKYSKTTVYSSEGLVTLPSDLMEVLRIRFCGTDLASAASAYDMPTSNGTYAFDDDTADDSVSTTTFAVMTGTTLQLFGTPTPIPADLTVTPTGSAGSTTYGYRVSAVTAAGTSIVCAEVTTTTGNATLSATNYNALTWTAIAGATEYKVYRTTGGATQGLLGSASTNAYDDTGIVATDVVLDDLIMHIWYKAYPATLVNATDVPSDIPAEFHPALVELYAKAQFVRKKGDYKAYATLMGEWEFIKKSIRGTVAARNVTVGEPSTNWGW